MSRYSGPQRRGQRKDTRELKRQQAEDRNANTTHEDTRAHRELRCEHGR
jgi:hypothetical protein